MSQVPHPYTLEHAREWINSTMTQETETCFVIEIDGQVAGGVGLHPLKDEASTHVAELGYWLGTDYWGVGVMTEVVAAFTEWGFERLQLVRIFAAVYARNPASARVLEKAGFQFEGRQPARYYKEGEYIDGLIFAKVRLPAYSISHKSFPKRALSGNGRRSPHEVAKCGAKPVGELLRRARDEVTKEVRLEP